MLAVGQNPNKVYQETVDSSSKPRQRLTKEQRQLLLAQGKANVEKINATVNNILQKINS